jgi:hypothetical protein
VFYRLRSWDWDKFIKKKIKKYKTPLSTNLMLKLGEKNNFMRLVYKLIERKLKKKN